MVSMMDEYTVGNMQTINFDITLYIYFKQKF